MGLVELSITLPYSPSSGRSYKATSLEKTVSKINKRIPYG